MRGTWKLNAVRKFGRPSASIRSGAHAESGPARITVLPEVGQLGFSDDGWLDTQPCGVEHGRDEKASVLPDGAGL